MDAFARGMKVASALRADGRISEFVRERYASWDGEFGRKIEAGKSSFAELHAAAVAAPDPTLRSGRQELLESIINQVLSS